LHCATGHVAIVAGSPGGSRIITITLGVLQNIIDYGMNVAAAVARRDSTINNGCPIRWISSRAHWRRRRAPNSLVWAIRSRRTLAGARPRRS
jgi:gamma-glutamyltranspeptidase